jgi:centrosomal protein POC5
VEFEQSRLRSLDEMNKKMSQEMEKTLLSYHQVETRLKRSLDLLATYEQSITRKDSVIQNLTKSLHRQKEKVELAKSFGIWKDKHNEDKREVSILRKI